MFAYCRNNPASRIDIPGTADVDCIDDDPLDDEDILKARQGGGGQSSNNSHSSGNGNGGYSSGTRSNSGSNSGNTSFGGKGFSLIKFIKGLLNIPNSSGEITINSSQILDLAIKYLGEGYTEASADRYVSADGSRQVRAADHDLACPYDSPHMNFDMLDPYKTVHVYFYDD